jgi:hypothetical protein
MLKNIAFKFYPDYSDAELVTKMLDIVLDFNLPHTVDISNRPPDYFDTFYTEGKCMFVDFKNDVFFANKSYTPFMVMHINLDEDPEDYFERILEWLNDVYCGNTNFEIDNLIVKTTLVQCDNPPEQEGSYTFRHEGNKYEICQPNVLPPFTTIADNVIDLFTNLFVCKSFGCEDDVTFLAMIWDSLDMNEEFDLDRLLREREEKLRLDPSNFPRVYRKKLEEV